jgi:hypothetical protein
MAHDCATPRLCSPRPRCCSSFPFPVRSRRHRQAQEHHHGLVEPDHILVIPPADPFADLDFGTVAILSTVSREGERKPLRSFGFTGSRNKGASVGSLVKAQIVIESVASKLSSYTITTGRGLPA